MADIQSNLTDRWFGRYEGPALLINDPVPFEIDLVDIGGVLSGRVSEPNSFRPELGATLTATITGEARGVSVCFRKRYDGFEQEDPIYDGSLNASCDRITGAFYFELAPTLRGRFMMVRARLTKARRSVAATRQKETTL